MGTARFIVGLTMKLRSRATLTGSVSHIPAFDSDERDGAFKFYIGHRINRSFAIEASFLSLGEFSAATTITNVVPPARLVQMAEVTKQPTKSRFALSGRISSKSAATTPGAMETLVCFPSG